MSSGRKREFNKAVALSQAMEVFWKKGFLGASLSELTEAMGINKPSLYAAFGNKEALFLEATRHYMEHYASKHSRELTDSHLGLEQRLANYLSSVVRGQCNEHTPKGCYVSLCVSEAAADDMPERAKELIDEVSGYALTLLTDLFRSDEEAQQRGLNKRARENALLLVSVIHGTAAMARAGHAKKDLIAVTDQSLKAIF